MLQKFYAWIRSKNGATAIEYSLLAAGISVGLIAVVVLIGPQLSGIFQDVADGFVTIAG
jgi:pilus assembly protein Flp/PilA